MKKLFLLLLALHCGLVYANKPLLAIVPQGPLPTEANHSKPATALYTVTNNASYTLQGLGLHYEPMGRTPSTVTQNTSAVNIPATCADPFILTPGQSCTLALEITGAAVGGPELCFTEQNPSRCSLPAKEDQLNVGVLPGLAYIIGSDGVLGKVLSCSIDVVTGNLLNCVNTGASVYTGNDLALVSLDSGSYAYLSTTPIYPETDVAPYRCEVSDEGVFSNCQAVPSITGLPTNTCGVASHTSDQNYLYFSKCFVNHVPYAVVKCSLDSSNGDITQCSDSGVSSGLLSDGVGYITFQYYQNILYAYIGNFTSIAPSGHVVQCTVQTNGDFADCTTSPVPNGVAPEVAFATVHGIDYGYVTQGSQGDVLKCAVSASTGALSDCAAMTPTFPGLSQFDEPWGISLATTQGTLYAYIADVASRVIWQCSINPSTGDFDSCTGLAQGNLFIYPNNIIIP